LHLRYAGDQMLTSGSCKNISLKGSTLQDSMNVGVRMTGCDNCHIDGITVERTGLFAGMGASGDNQYFEVDVGGQGFMLENSVVRDSGYIGIAVYGPATVRNNVVSGFNRVKVDGGGIYAYQQRDVAILNNIVHDAVGGTAGTPSTFSTQTHGIYLDDDTQQVLVQGNTVANVSGAGVYLHNNRDVTVTGNLIYNAGEEGIQMTDDALSPFALEGATLQHNQIVERGVPMISVLGSVTDTIISGFGVIDDNTFCDPSAEPTFRVELPTKGWRIESLAQWRQMGALDASSNVCMAHYPTRVVNGPPGPNRITNGSFDADLNTWFGWPDTTLDAHWESGRLDGGSLYFGFNGRAPAPHFDNWIDAVKSGETYRLRLDAIAISGAPGLSVYLRQADGPYAPAGQEFPLIVDGTRRSYEVFLDVTAPQTSTLLIFQMSVPTTSVGIDNVQLQKVDAPLAPITTSVRFESNPSSQPLTVTLDTYAYRGLDDRLYAPGSAVALAPFSALVLLRGARYPWQIALPVLRRAST